MTIDTSAVIAILENEPERSDFIDLIDAAPRRLMSSVSVLEASIVLTTRAGENAETNLDLFLHRASVEIVPFDAEQLRWARRAFNRFGKRRHPAALNFGDCVSYALAQWSGEPLLFKGADFAATDVPRVR
jgi:ribonuclease VapC